MPDEVRAFTDETAAATESIWEKLRYLAVQVLKFGSFLGVVSAALYGRGFKPGELGLFFWPLVAVYLSAMLYLLGHVVFTMASRVRYLVIPLYCLMVSLLLSAAVWTLFFEE